MSDTSTRAFRLDQLLQKVLAVSLQPTNSTTAGSDPVVHLSSLADELAAEKTNDASALLLSADMLDRIIVTRLMDVLDYPKWPVPYLMSCYKRAADEHRSVSVLKDKDWVSQLQQCLSTVKDMAVRHTALLLGDVFPQPDAACKRGALQLLDALQDGTMPPGFMEDLCMTQDAEDREQLAQWVLAMVQELAVRVTRMSILGDWGPEVQVLGRLLAIKPLALAFVNLPQFLPSPLPHGRLLQSQSLLGPFFGLTAIPDPLTIAMAQPSVVASFFSNLEQRNQVAIHNAMNDIRIVNKQLYCALHSITEALLRNKDTRDRTMAWLAAAIESNKGRSKMQVDYFRTSTTGFAINVSVVLLKLCEPFLDPDAGKAWGKLDVWYLFSPQARINTDPENDTKLSASMEEEKGYVAELNSNGQNTVQGTAHFICESFFMTAKALRLGVIKAMQDVEQEGQAIGRFRHRLADMEAEARHAAPHMVARYQAQITRIKQEIQQLTEMQYCSLSVLDVLGSGSDDVQDDYVLQLLLSYNRLQAVWMLRLIQPSYNSGAPLRLPLPDPCPWAFRLLPEYFVEDTCEALSWVSRGRPQLLDPPTATDFMMFSAVLPGQPSYIKNPFLRYKLVEGLQQWLPEGERSNLARGRRPTNSSLALLFEANSTVTSNLVPTLLRLFTDIQHIDRAGQFYEKFRMRNTISELLEYLWKSPPHQVSWGKVANAEGGRGLYLKFCDMLVNDTIHLLDDALGRLPKIREAETLMADPMAWEAVEPTRRQEIESELQTNTDTTRWSLGSAQAYVKTLRYSTARYTASFLLDEMVERTAGLLNYFLMYLTGPERRKLKVKDPEKYEWNPKELLTSIATVYLHIARADKDGKFTRAITLDKRSYRTDMFSDCTKVLRQLGTLPEQDVAELEALGHRAQQAAEVEAAEDELEEDAPEEFLDPIMSTVMRDPVTMPTSGQTIDRATIARHLLSERTDPFSRKPLSVQDLIPNTELKRRIDAWLTERRQQRSAARVSSQTQPMEM